jgi:hypothetical protein
VDPAPDPRLRARRAALCVVIVSFFGILGALSVAAEKFENIFVQLDMRVLPAPTEAFLALARVVRSAVGFVVLTLGAAAGVACVLRGRFDPRLKGLTRAALVLAAFLIAVFVLGLYLPIVRIQTSLSK